LKEKKNRRIVTGLMPQYCDLASRGSGMPNDCSGRGAWPSPQHLVAEPAHANRVRRARIACGHLAAGASSGAAANGGLVALAMRGQRHENWGRPGCMPDVEGSVDSHPGTLSTVSGSVAEERWCSGYGGTPAGGGDLRVALWHREAKGKLRRDLQGGAMVARAELTVRTSRRRCSSVIPPGRRILVAGGG
jgi:hypothetical protein